jgi:RNA polymerase sigma-70 factor (ECF subfamily)
MPSPPIDWAPGDHDLDTHALAEIYDTLSPALYRYAYRLLGEARSAEDVVAESFQRLLLALRGDGGPRHNLKAYLYRVAHNLVVDRYRRREARGEALNLEALDLPADDDPAQEAAREIARQQARAALWRLTADQRQVIVLKYYEGLSNEEVAGVLNKPVGAVKSLQHRALDSLRRMLAAEAK